MNDHLTEERLFELLKDNGSQFSKEELQHLTDCQECGEAVSRLRQSLSEKVNKLKR